MDVAIEKSAMRKIYLRLLPFAILSYILAYIDRINVSFAGLTMRGDLKLVCDRFRLCAGNILLGLLHFRGAEQRHHGKGWRTALDSAHHDYVGLLRGPDGVCLRHDELLHCQVPARRR